MKHKDVTILKGVRVSRILYQIGKKQFVRELEESIDENLLLSPISIEDFENDFNFQETHLQLPPTNSIRNRKEVN